MSINETNFALNGPGPQSQMVVTQGTAIEKGYPRREAIYVAESTAAEAFFIAFNEYLRVLRRYKFLILSILLAFVAIGGLRTILVTRIYTASMRLQVDPNASKIVEGGNVTPAELGDFVFLRTQIELLQSRSIADRTVSSLKLASDPTFLKPNEFSVIGFIERIFTFSSKADARPQAALEQAAAKIILSNRVIRPVAGSRLIDILYSDSNPDRARRIAMGLADAFIASNLDKRFQANAYAKTFLEDQLKQLKIRLEESEKAMIDFGQKEQIIDTNDKSSIAENNLASANVTLGNLVAERIKNEELYKQVEAAGAATLPQFLTNTTIQGLRDKRNALVTDFQQKLQIFKPSYPAMVQISNQIKEIDRQLSFEIKTTKSSFKGAYDASLSQEAQMRARIDQLRADVIDLQKRSIQYNILKREADSNRTIYNSLLQRYKEVDVAGGIGANNVFIVDKAQTPTSPSSPKVLTDLLISAILGALAGLAAAFVLERLDNSVTSSDEMEQLSGISTLGVIPKAGADTTVEIELLNSRSPMSEAYRTLCTSLHFVTENGLPKSLMFTSAEAAEGKSTTALTVGRHFASMGMRVLLIDGDLRKPSLHTKLGLDNAKGLSNYLTGACSPPDAMQYTSTKNLTFMASGPLPPNASDILGSQRLGSLLSVGSEVFDLIIIDCPPVLGLADAQLLSNAVAATVFVVCSGATSKQSIRGAIKRLRFARGNLIGSVLTRYDAKNDNYGYGYGYGYGQDAIIGKVEEDGKMLGDDRKLAS